MKWERIRVYQNILPVDHYALKKCQCFKRTSHCSRDLADFKPRSTWASHVRLPAPEECRQKYLPNALVLASTEYGGYRIVMPTDPATVDRELARHNALRSEKSSLLKPSMGNGRYEYVLKKLLRDVRKLKSLTGNEALELFLEKVSTYFPEMLPYVLACGEATDAGASPNSQLVSLNLIGM